MAADYAALEARVADLEQQMRHILPAKIDAMNFGISILHEDQRALREETERRLDAMDGRFDGIDGRLDAMDGRLDSHGAMLQEILRRLPG
jgi:hypothetical protein